MSGLTLQVTVSTIAGIIDLLGGATRLIVDFALKEMVHKRVEVKMKSHGRVRIVNTAQCGIKGKHLLSVDFRKILVLLGGALLTLLASLAIFFIEPQRRVGGTRTVTVNEIVLCNTLFQSPEESPEESPACEPRFIYFFNTSGSNLSETIVRFPVVGGLLNAEETVNNSIVTSLDCSVITRPGQPGGEAGQCDTELMTTIGDTYDEDNVFLRKKLSYVFRLAFQNTVFLADVQTWGQHQPPIRTRKLCVTDQSMGVIEYCGVWFHREGTREIIVSWAHKLKEGYKSCDETKTEMCEIGRISVNRNTAVIVRHYDGLARMMRLTPGSFEFFDTVTEILITRDMVMTRAIWDVLEGTNSRVVPVERNATGGMICEDTLVTIDALAMLGVGALILLAAFLVLLLLRCTSWKRSTKYPLYDFDGVTHSLLRSVSEWGTSEGKHKEKGKCFEISALPLDLTMTKVRDRDGIVHNEMALDTSRVKGILRLRESLTRRENATSSNNRDIKTTSDIYAGDRVCGISSINEDNVLTGADNTDYT